MSYHFISGLPRSGSTLLASILLQNPECHAGIISPMATIIRGLKTSTGPTQETHVFVNVSHRMRMFEAVFDAYYEEKLDKVVFDSNRGWCADIGLLTRLFPKSRVIACVRNPARVVDSFERLFHKHPSTVSTITRCDPNTTLYDRVPQMMKPDGVIGYAYNALREAYYGPDANRLILLEYANLTAAPKETMGWLHSQLGLAPFTYDFENIQQIPGVDLFDKTIGAPGLHTLKPKVAFHEDPWVLPADVVSRMPPAFWRPDVPVKKAETSTG